MTSRPDDELWVAQAIEGDERAFAEIYRRYEPVLSRRLRRVLLYVEDVEDVVQATFVEAHRSLKRFRKGAPLEAWLHGIAFKLASGQLRSRGRSQRLKAAAREVASASSGGSAQAADEQAIRRQTLERVKEALERLPPKKRIAFALHELEGMGLTEIGAALGASPQTVWARVESARKEILEHLRRAGDLSSRDESQGAEP